MTIKTQSAITAEIASQIVVNSTGAVTAPILAGVLQDLNDTLFSVAGSSSAMEFLNFRAALANSLAGVSKTTILCLGDSTTFGTGSVSGLYGPGVKNNSYPTLLAKRLASAGIKSNAQNCFGDAGYGVNLPTYDPRLSLGSWAMSGSITCLCGETYSASAATSTPMTFTPTIPTDTCEIYYVSGNGTAAAFNCNINGGANTLVSTWTGLAWNISKVVLTGSLASNVYECTWASGASVFIIGFNAYNSADKEVSVINCGWGGSTAESQLNAFPALPIQIAAFNPSLIIMQTGINDWLTGAALATYQASLASWIAAKPSNCDLLMMAPIQTSSSTIAFATQAPYQAAFLSAAATNGIPVIDQNLRNGGFAAANAAGMMASDGTHGSAAWYGDEANLIANLLMRT